MAHSPPEQPKLRWMEFLRKFLSVAGRLSLLLTALLMLLLARAMIYNPTKHDLAEMELESLQEALGLYQSKHQRYPSTEEGLRALLEGLKVNWILFDPWGHPYRYELREGRPWVWSLGADGAPGGEDEDADAFLVGEN